MALAATVLRVPLRGQRRSSPVAQFLVVRPLHALRMNTKSVMKKIGELLHGVIYAVGRMSITSYCLERTRRERRQVD